MPQLISIAYWLLALRQIKSGAFWLSPCFTLYCTLIPFHYLTWSPHNIPTLILWEPLLSILKLGIVTELFLLSTRWICPTERRWLLAALCLLMAIGVVAIVGYYHGGKLLDIYKNFRLQLHLALALATGLGTLLIPSRVPKPIFNHGMIICLFFSTHVATNLLPLNWKEANLLFWLASLTCITMWFTLGLPNYARSKQPV